MNWISSVITHGHHSVASQPFEKRREKNSDFKSKYMYSESMPGLRFVAIRSRSLTFRDARYSETSHHSSSLQFPVRLPS
jgi:hypothetical protein